MADYTTALAVRSLATDSGFTTDTSYDTLLGSLITAASRMIDRYVGGWDNYFASSTDDETRYYNGSGTDELDIDASISITSVSVAEDGGRAATDYTDWTVTTDYYTHPYNALPIRRLIVEEDGDKYGFHRSRKSVKVTGRFGYSESAPADVALACQIQVSRWFMRAKGSFQDASAAASVGQIMYTKELDPDVKNLLHHYRVMNEGL